MVRVDSLPAEAARSRISEVAAYGCADRRRTPSATLHPAGPEGNREIGSDMGRIGRQGNDVSIVFCGRKTAPFQPRVDTANRQQKRRKPERQHRKKRC
jgi:hypothetical protein